MKWYLVLGCSCIVTVYWSGIDLLVCLTWQVNSFCHRGKCNTRDTQCTLLWGVTGRPSHGLCFEHYNILGNGSGNCGADWINGKPLFRKCEPQYEIFISRSGMTLLLGICWKIRLFWKHLTCGRFLDWCGILPISGRRNTELKFCRTWQRHWI